jgi:4-methylaminobutanoate oxidase (formaldehyde-forming)
MDLSFMAKVRVQGTGAGALLDRLSAGAVDGAAGVITYTQWLNGDGRIEADLTVTKLDDDDFLVVASDTAHGHVRARLHRFADAAVTITDVTADYAQLNVQGPVSRDVLAVLTDADLSTEAFPFRSAGWVELAGVRLLLARITYLGELGYELYVPAADALTVYDAVASAGVAHGIRPVGLKALASLRIEKAYRDYGHDIDNTDCPLEAGLGFALAFDKATAFIGRDAVLARKAANDAAGGMAQRLVQVRLLDPEPLLYHAEIVLRDGRPVGYLRAGSYGWTLGSAVGLAMVEGGAEPVTADWLASGRWEVDVAGTRHPAEVSLRPMYDPTSSRVRV